MKKFRIPSELSYVLAMIIMPIAVEFTKAANFGLSMVVAPAYLVSELVPALTFGQAEYCVQALLLVAMCIVLRKFKVTYLFSFLTAFIYGNILDGVDLFMRYLPTDNIGFRVLFFVVGTLLTTISVSLFFNTYFIPQAYDFFVREVQAKFSLNMTKFKLAYDWSSFGVSVILAAVIYLQCHQIKGIGIGTVVTAIVNGFIIGAECKFLERRVEFFDLIKIRKYFE